VAKAAKGEVDLQLLLEAAGCVDLDEEVGRLVADGAPAVWDAGGDHDGVAWARLSVVVAELDADGAGEHLEALVALGCTCVVVTPPPGAHHISKRTRRPAVSVLRRCQRTRSPVAGFSMTSRWVMAARSPLAAPQREGELPRHPPTLVRVTHGSERTVVGRDRELAALDAALESAGAGAGAAVAIVGEAGIGKSTLLHALAQRAAAAGMLVLEGRAAEHEADVSYGPVVDGLDAEVERLGVSRLASLGADREAQLAAVLPGVARGRDPAGIAGAEPAMAAGGAAARFHRHRSS
jgi:hypothetical protein